MTTGQVHNTAIRRSRSRSTAVGGVRPPRSECRAPSCWERSASTRWRAYAERSSSSRRREQCSYKAGPKLNEEKQKLLPVLMLLLLVLVAEASAAASCVAAACCDGIAAAHCGSLCRRRRCLAAVATRTLFVLYFRAAFPFFFCLFATYSHFAINFCFLKASPAIFCQLATQTHQTRDGKGNHFFWRKERVFTKNGFRKHTRFNDKKNVPQCLGCGWCGWRGGGAVFGLFVLPRAGEAPQTLPLPGS